MSKISYDSIINNFASNTALKKMFELEDNKEAFTKTLDGAIASHYNDLAELQDSGNSSIYNQALHDVIMEEVYRTSTIAVNNELDNQQLFINNIRKTIDVFKNDFVTIRNDPSTVMTKVDLCNRTLTEIMNILNTKDSFGKYLFGGMNSTDLPCNNLTIASNLDAAGNALNNYTSATPNIKEISISNNSTIKIGIDASDKTFATLIGAINRIKNSNNIIPTPPEVEILYNELDSAVDGIDGMATTIINNREAIKNAETDNEAASLHANDILASSSFIKSPNKVVQEIVNYARSQKLLQAIIVLNNKTSNSLLNLISPAT